jgi:hypothetical protein
MRQEKGSEPSSGGIVIQPMEKRIEYRIEKEGKRADHDHNFESHDEEYDDAAPRRYPFDLSVKAFHSKYSYSN